MSVSPQDDADQPVGTDILELRENATISAYETIPIPRLRARYGKPFRVVTDKVRAWPRQRLIWTFEYNDYSSRWVMQCRHEDHGVLFDGRAWASLGRTYSEWPYFMAHFITTGGGHHPPERVTAQNLGDTVKLAVAPGPAGGRFPEAAGLTDEEEYAILGRYSSDYPVTAEWV